MTPAVPLLRFGPEKYFTAQLGAIDMFGITGVFASSSTLPLAVALQLDCVEL
jgi:hypothetical protein